MITSELERLVELRHVGLLVVPASGRSEVRGRRREGGEVKSEARGRRGEERGAQGCARSSPSRHPNARALLPNTRASFAAV